jgi:hypothetical protein
MHPATRPARIKAELNPEPMGLPPGHAVSQNAQGKSDAPDAMVPCFTQRCRMSTGAEVILAARCLAGPQLPCGNCWASLWVTRGRPLP